MFAVFSAAQKQVVGSSIYRRADGSEVEVTSVGSADGCPATAWADKINLGEVVAYVRPEHVVRRDRIQLLAVPTVTEQLRTP